MNQGFFFYSFSLNEPERRIKTTHSNKKLNWPTYCMFYVLLMMQMNYWIRVLNCWQFKLTKSNLTNRNIIFLIMAFFSLFYFRLDWKGDILLNCQIFHSSILPHSLTLSFLIPFSISFSHSTHSFLINYKKLIQKQLCYMSYLLSFTEIKKWDETRGPTTEEDDKTCFFSCPKTTAESARIIVVRFTNTVKHTVSMCTRTAFVMDVTHHVFPNPAATLSRSTGTPVQTLPL